MKEKFILSISLILLLALSVQVYSGRIPYEGRRIINYQNEDGSYKTIPKKGEKYPNGDIVMHEWLTNGDFIHQWVDIDNDGVCDYRAVWKPLDDPHWGRFYTILEIKDCKGDI